MFQNRLVRIRSGFGIFPHFVKFLVPRYDSVSFPWSCLYTIDNVFYILLKNHHCLGMYSHCYRSIPFKQIHFMVGLLTSTGDQGNGRESL